MNSKIYVSPFDLSALHLTVRDGHTDVAFVADNGMHFDIKNGIPDFTYPEQDSKNDKVRTFYDNRAEAYDQNLHLTFYTHNKDEKAERERFIDKLRLKPDSKVLEVACGTGRDSELIADKLSDKGMFYLQDISPNMLQRCMQKLNGVKVPVEFSLGNSAYLPFPDKYFDAVYSFGGIGEFSDIKRSLSEMVRVTKTGGRIVVGDESMPPWLRNTEYAKILNATNPQFSAEVPLRDIPVEARDLILSWVIGGVFYLIDFTVGEGEPKANFDFEIPGVRGGTYRTRYAGQLEGVTPEVKLLAEQAREKCGISMHKWLNEVVKTAAIRDIKGDA